MKVFTEWHHGGLFHSQQMLWEGRLGGMLFAPVGTQWVTEGYWKLSELPQTIKQYLDPLSCEKGSDGYLYYFDPSENIKQRRITFEQFKDTKFDIILCTLQEHEVIYRDLQKKYQPQAKFIRLSGNTGERTDFSIFDNFIDTTGIYAPPPYLNTVQMAQEFPLESFYYEEPKNYKTIKNFMNEMNNAKSLPIWQGLKEQLPEFSFKMHGSNGDDGMIAGLPALGDSMRDMAFLFHVKHHGEGFGHVIHNSYSVGRPAIAMIEFYRGKLAEHFLIDDYSAILIDDKNYKQLEEKIRYWSIPENLLQMCKNARGLFEKYVNFDEDERRFRKFLENLK